MKPGKYWQIGPKCVTRNVGKIVSLSGSVPQRPSLQSVLSGPPQAALGEKGLILSCQRFGAGLATQHASFGAGVVRYAFTIKDLHLLLLAGLRAHSNLMQFRIRVVLPLGENQRHATRASPHWSMAIIAIRNAAQEALPHKHTYQFCKAREEPPATCELRQHRSHSLRIRRRAIHLHQSRLRWPPCPASIPAKSGPQTWPRHLH